MSTAWCEADGPDISSSCPVVLSPLLSQHLLVIVRPFQQSLLLSFQTTLPDLSDRPRVSTVAGCFYSQWSGTEFRSFRWWWCLLHRHNFTFFSHVSESTVLRGAFHFFYLSSRRKPCLVIAPPLSGTKRRETTSLHVFPWHLGKPQPYCYFPTDSKYIGNILAISVLFKSRNSYKSQRRPHFSEILSE